MRHFLRKAAGHCLLLTVTFAVSMVLTASVWGDEIKMKNVDEPFIDLDVMVGDLDISAEGGDETQPETEAEEMIQEFVISIRETEIRYNGNKVDNSSFQNIFDALYSKKYGTDTTVRLVDDYAEYYTYKSMLEFLQKKGIKPVEEKK